MTIVRPGPIASTSTLGGAQWKPNAMIRSMSRGRRLGGGAAAPHPARLHLLRPRAGRRGRRRCSRAGCGAAAPPPSRRPRDIDRIMAFGFHWAPPSVLVDAIGPGRTIVMLERAYLPVPRAVVDAALHQRALFDEPRVDTARFFVVA